MKKCILFFNFLFIILVQYTNAQSCITLGQTPPTAFPVCGTDTFYQTNVPICVNKTIKTFCTDGVPYTDKNPFWYKFTCYATGTLGFKITPNNLTDDYDWVLFDITNHNPNDVYDSTNLIVTYNWSGNTSTESARGYTGITGTDASATDSFVCSTNPKELGGAPPYSDASTFNKMPTIIKGHVYLLMVSHYTSSQSGYKLSFGGGTASITDPSLPTFLSASAICGGDKIYFKTSKRIKCSSIAANGTDFNLLPNNNINIDSAKGYGCDVGFDTDSIVLYLNTYLTPGNYTLIQKIGTDGNTLLDNCNSAIAVGDNTSFNINAQQLLKAGFTYNIAYGCREDVVYAYLGGRDISNFAWYVDSLVYTQPNIVISYKNFGNKTIKLVASNSVCIDSMVVNFNLPEPTIKAIFSGPEFACPNDTIRFKDESLGQLISWNWDFGNGVHSSLQSPPTQTYAAATTSKEIPIRLIVADASCSDTTYRLLKMVPNCYIAVPSAFTPNNDGLNDYLYPLNAYKAINLVFRVYNRYGQIVFEGRDRTAKWDGTFKGIQQAAGTYVWTLQYTEPDTGKWITQKGTAVLIR